MTSRLSTGPGAAGGRPGRRSSVLIRKGSVHAGTLAEGDLDGRYALVRQVGAGRFGAVHLAEDKTTRVEIAVKIFSKKSVRQADFLREYNYSFFLSPHPNVVETFEGPRSAGDRFFFAQEFCRGGNLREAVLARGRGGLGEEAVKRVAGQVAAALEFMHGEGLVHRGLAAENVLVFDEAFAKVKLCEFGWTRQEGTRVKSSAETGPYLAPELCEKLLNEPYTVDRSVDVWALGVLVYFALRGRFPWTKASITICPYWEWEEWLKRKNPQLPPRWHRFTEKALKFFKRSLNPKSKERCAVKDVKKFLKDAWIREEAKSLSDDDLNSPEESRSVRESLAELKLERPGGASKPKSALQQWFLATMSAMTEISEQVVSATEVND